MANLTTMEPDMAELSGVLDLAHKPTPSLQTDSKTET
jgi:hypothetical protein